MFTPGQTWVSAVDVWTRILLIERDIEPGSFNELMRRANRAFASLCFFCREGAVMQPSGAVARVGPAFLVRVVSIHPFIHAYFDDFGRVGRRRFPIYRLIRAALFKENAKGRRSSLRHAKIMAAGIAVIEVAFAWIIYADLQPSSLVAKVLLAFSLVSWLIFMAS